MINISLFGKKFHFGFSSLFFLTIIYAAFLFFPFEALASSVKSTALYIGLCRVQDALQSDVGKIIAAIVLITLAFALTLGKVTWGLAIAVGSGVALIFGAADIVAFIGDGEKINCEDTTLNCLPHSTYAICIANDINGGTSGTKCKWYQLDGVTNAGATVINGICLP